jgi:Holliday junction resolvase RusA-like endonuclease
MATLNTCRYDVTPRAKLRMTRRDSWGNGKVRPAVERWRAFKDAVRVAGVTVEDGDALTFHLPMPASWSAKKRARHDGQPHRATPDLDNLIGGLFDAAMPDGDQHIAELGPCRKVWASEGAIDVARKKATAIP